MIKAMVAISVSSPLFNWLPTLFTAPIVHMSVLLILTLFYFQQNGFKKFWIRMLVVASLCFTKYLEFFLVHFRFLTGMGVLFLAHKYLIAAPKLISSHFVFRTWYIVDTSFADPVKKFSKYRTRSSTTKKGRFSRLALLKCNGTKDFWNYI